MTSGGIISNFFKFCVKILTTLRHTLYGRFLSLLDPFGLKSLSRGLLLAGIIVVRDIIICNHLRRCHVVTISIAD